MKLSFCLDFVTNVQFLIILMWYITLLLICEFQNTHQSNSGKEYLGFQNSLNYKLDRIFTQNNGYRICFDFFEQLVNNTDSFMMNIRNLSFSSELQLNTTRNQNSTGNSSVETQVSFIIASIVCFVGVSGNFATLVFFLVQKKVQTPAYTVILCSSIADLTALISRYLIIFVSFIMLPTMGINYKYLYGITALTHISSNFHVLIIAIIRYIYISKPFYSQISILQGTVHVAWCLGDIFSDSSTLYRSYLPPGNENDV